MELKELPNSRGAPPHGDTPGVSPLLARAALNAMQDTRLVAHLLAGHRERHALDDAAQARYLGCSIRALHALSLCLCPRPDTPAYLEELRALAAYIGCAPGRLHAVLED